MADIQDTTENRRNSRDAAAAPPPAARVRDDDLEPHEGLRYIAKLFKALALLLVFMLIAEVVLGLQQDGMPALGMLLVEATRLVVFAGFLWAAGDLAVLLIESNHDLRASRILLGRLNGRMERFLDDEDRTETVRAARDPRVDSAPGLSPGIDRADRDPRAARGVRPDG